MKLHTRVLCSILVDDVQPSIYPYRLVSSLRIVSSVSSITELIVDLGLAAHLVGRTGFCIHPANAVRSIPKVGGTKNVQLDKLRLLCPSHVVVNIDENERSTAKALSPTV